MISGFWNELKKPIYALAPMLDVTDLPMRQMVVRHGKPDILFTEFVSAEGLCSAGRERLVQDLTYYENERPIVAQIYGKKPEAFCEAAAFLNELGFDGIDINMGCPVKNVTKVGSGAALINNPELAREIILATKEGAKTIPVSVKTRIGFNEIVIEEWVEHLLRAEPVAITLHLRTRSEMSNAPAHWDKMNRAVEVAKGSETLILGNGDVTSLTHADQLVEETGIDGILFGRAIFGNPWLFNRDCVDRVLSVDERLDAIVEHAELFTEIMGPEKNFLSIRKHLRSYVSEFKGSKQLRIALQETAENLLDVRRLVDQFRSSQSNQDED